MNTDKRRLGLLHLRVTALICGFVVWVCVRGFAQPAKPVEGLDALNDDALMNELASRRLDTLLERAFEVNQVPAEQRQGRRTVMALSRLADPNARLTLLQRQKLVSEIVGGIDKALMTLDDPQLLMRQAYVLITQAVERDANTLEYWGENPRTQATLRPIVQAVIRILEKCEQQAKRQADELAGRITSPNSPEIARYEQIERLAATAEYTRRMVEYYLALSLDASSAQRQKIATDAMAYLKQYDVADNPDRCLVRNRMAKFALVKGDVDLARKLLAATLADTGQPPATIAQQYEARCFLAVAEILARNVAGATTRMNELLRWQEQNLPSDKAARDGAEAAAAMLKYRIHNLQADLARDSSAKAQANQQAVAVLVDLLARRPDLRAIIYEQLLPRLDDSSKLSSLDPLLLRALIARGEQELLKPRDEPIDEKALERAIEAANEVQNRQSQSGIDGQMIDASALLVGYFLERLSRPIDAANSFIDYAEQRKRSNPANAKLALDNAQGIIGQLRADPATRDDLAIVRAYERFLPVAIADPFNRRQFAYEYARRLQLNGKPAEAAEYYQLVPADDKRLPEARFLHMLALKQRLDDEPLAQSQRAELLSQIQKLSDELQGGRGDDAKSLRARAALVAADLARREQKDPRRAIDLLGGFEQSVQGLPTADPLINQAMYIRVQACMALEQYNDATAELVKLLNKTEGAQGAQIVYNLLEKLNADFDRAQQAGDRPAMRQLAKDRAQLSGFLVDWAANNPDPNIRRFTYRYRVFDAETQRRAADLEDDNPAAHEAGMKLALERYTALESAQNVALYKSSLDPAAAAEPEVYDPQVTFGIALIHYDLGSWQQAATRFSKLLVQRKLGTAVIRVEEDGQLKTVDNDKYWEAILKLIRCNRQLGTGIEESRNYLKQQYITWGPRVGGKKWKHEYQTLRQELIPGFHPGQIATTQTSP